MKSRAGAGKTGNNASNACSVTFAFAPTAIFIIGVLSDTDFSIFGSGYYGALISSLTTSYTNRRMMSFGTSFKSYVKKSSDGKTVYWYNESANTNPYDTSGAIYYFLALT